VRLQALFGIELQLRLSGHGHASRLQVRHAMPLRGRLQESVVAFVYTGSAAANTAALRSYQAALFFVRAPAIASDT